MVQALGRLALILIITLTFTPATFAQGKRTNARDILRGPDWYKKKTVKAWSLALYSKGPKQVLEALKALGLYGEDARPVSAAVTKQLDNKNETIAFAAAVCLMKMGIRSEKIEQVLSARLNSKSVTKRVNSLRALKFFYKDAVDKSAWVKILLAKLSDKDFRVKMETYSALAETGPQGAKTLITALKDPKQQGRHFIPMILTELKVPARMIEPALIQAAKESDWKIRAASAQALGEIYNSDRKLSEAGYNCLVKLSEDSDAKVKKTAIDVLN